MKTERELFEEWVVKNITDGKFRSWEEWCWKAWQSSTSRDGYKLLPLQPTKEMVTAYYSTTKPTAERCYKAMIGAYNADNE